MDPVTSQSSKREAVLQRLESPDRTAERPKVGDEGEDHEDAMGLRLPGSNKSSLMQSSGYQPRFLDAVRERADSPG